ncbi:stomatin-like protein 1 isoform X2 [Oratosquilla oratoria]|uniref:stomatin-like protein 1 isoform X2 n=1 Tax=Oratosquilla oratoria TaxID=337810 RepID=UPI003F771C57
MVSYAKYSLVPTEDPKDAGEASKPTSAFDYSSAFNYKSAFDYKNNSSQYQSAFDYGYGHKAHSVSLTIGDKDKKKKKSEGMNVMGCISSVVTGISYAFICLTFPITLWFCIKKLDQWERLIIFRLGRLRGVKGPGTVFVIPWLDRYTRVDMRTKAFSVPPQQLITADNGIIEMGCEVKYRVSDIQQLTTSVSSPQQGLRSFGKTVLLNVLTKHTVRETERDRPMLAAEIQKQLNLRVLEWGIEIGQVELSTVNILKEPEPDNPIKPLLNCMGAGSNTTVAGFPDFSGMGGLSSFSAPGASSRSDAAAAGLAQLVDISEVNSGTSSSMTPVQSEMADSRRAITSGSWRKSSGYRNDRGNSVMGSSAPKTKLGRYLQSLVVSPGSGDLTHGVYRLQVEGDEAGVFIIFIGNGVKQVVEGDLPKVTPDVAVTISKSDLLAIFDGTLSPLQAYLSGHLTVQGNSQMLMGLESLRQAPKEKDKDDIFIV